MIKVFEGFSRRQQGLAPISGVLLQGSMVSGFHISNVVPCDLVGLSVQEFSHSESGISGSCGFDPVSGVASGSDGQGLVFIQGTGAVAGLVAGSASKGVVSAAVRSGSGLEEKGCLLVYVVGVMCSQRDEKVQKAEAAVGSEVEALAARLVGPVSGFSDSVPGAVSDVGVDAVCHSVSGVHTEVVVDAVRNSVSFRGCGSRSFSFIGFIIGGFNSSSGFAMRCGCRSFASFIHGYGRGRS